ncbi:uncharacterized protein LOC132309916 [Cornus florida]|uniref:uncharacterized protein LOC132309916 n=1 Tax=Cornus florida TaxID=4283 RepID=UPI00289FEFEA|nr:uncharacterized protein LOC132309916 [Cornus florida]
MSFLRFAPGIANDKKGKIEKFVDGLHLTIRPIVATSELIEYAKAVRKALVVEAESKDSKAIRGSYKHNRGMSAISEGQSHKKQKNEQSGFRGQQSARSAPTTSMSMGSFRSDVCFKCKQPGHYKAQCLHIYMASGRCFGCSQQGHKVRNCPQRGIGSGRGGGSQQRQTQSATGRVFVVTPADPSSSPSVVRGIFLMSHYWARVLFDSGASYAFITSSFARALGLEVSQLDRPLYVDTLVEGSVALSRVFWSCSITIAGRVLELNLILLEMTGFDVILGMDWLSSFRAVIDCFRGRVSICTLDGDCFCFVGDCVILFRGRDQQEFFLASLFADDDVEFYGVDYPEVVRDFLDVFPEDLTELPLHREVEFAIDLMLGTVPISMALYRMAPIELEELKK